MKVELKEDEAVITREPTDKKIYKESTLFYHIKQELIKQGHDVIVKDPAKDTKFAHLTSMPYYVRSRKQKKGVESFWVVDDMYALRMAYEDYNKQGVLCLRVERGIFDPQTAEDNQRRAKGGRP